MSQREEIWCSRSRARSMAEAAVIISLLIVLLLLSAMALAAWWNVRETWEVCFLSLMAGAYSIRFAVRWINRRQDPRHCNRHADPSDDTPDFLRRREPVDAVDARELRWG